MTPFILIVAPNGARRTKSDHPAIPLTADELGREAARCRDEGVAMIHLHVRDRDNRHSLDAGLYRDAIRAIRQQAGADLIIQTTTEAVGIYTPEQQIAMVRDLRPEAFSAAIREFMPDVAHEAAALAFFQEEQRRGALVQYILYDTADVARFQLLYQRGLIAREGVSVVFVLGRYTANQQSDPRTLLDFLNCWQLDLPWALCAFGAREPACAMAALTLGGHARVGFENNIWNPDGTPAADNASLVRRVAAAAAAIGLKVATPLEARAIFAGAASPQS